MKSLAHRTPWDHASLLLTYCRYTALAPVRSPCFIHGLHLRSAGGNFVQLFDERRDLRDLARSVLAFADLDRHVHLAVDLLPEGLVGRLEILGAVVPRRL